MTKVTTYIESELVFAENSKNPLFIDLVGLKYNRLTVLGLAEIIKYKPFWYCKCDCGKIVRVQGGGLRFGSVKSCGCLKSERSSEIIHGHSRKIGHTISYRCWNGMLQRCQNQNHESYHHYGGRGITVCQRWQKFENFLADMGEKPEGKTLDRIENDNGYFKENCRWATQIEQKNNTRRNVFLLYKGDSKTIAEWSRQLALSVSTIRKRIKLGWDSDKILSTPISENCRNKKSLASITNKGQIQF